MKIFSKSFLIFFVLLTTSCRWFSGDATEQFLRKFQLPTPPGSPMFKKGFKEGCAGILYARGNFFYRAIYKYEYDPSLNYNKDYRFGYKRGWNACFLRIITTKITSADRLIFPNGGGNDIGTGISSVGDYNDTSGMFGGIDSPIGPGGDVNGIFEMWSQGDNGAVFNSSPIWAGNSKGQFFGQ